MQQPPQSPEPQMPSQQWYPPSQSQQPFQSGPLGEQWQTPPFQPPMQPGMYPPQQPMQPGMYPPPQQPLKKKHTGRNVLIVVIALIVALAACGGIIAAVSNGAKSNTGTTSPPSSSSTQVTTQATSAPAQTGSQTFKIGQVVTVGNTWQITVLSATTSSGGEFNTLQKPSDVYLLVAVSMKNISGQEQDVSSLIQWGLKDSAGQTYNETIDPNAPATPDGKVEAGSMLKGTIAYEVPKSMKSFTLSFQNDITSTGEILWAITV